MFEYIVKKKIKGPSPLRAVSEACSYVGCETAVFFTQT